MKKRINTAMLTLIVSMSAWALEPVDGIYQIGSAAGLNEFAELVNSGTTDANAVLTADINGYSGTMIGTASVYYAGTFDGQYHKITYTTEPTEAVWGLFRTLSGTVRNLSVAGTVTTSQKQVGGIVGFLYSGTIENCISTVDITTSVNGDAGTGGIIASSVQMGGVIKDCVFAGSIKGQSANSCAGIAGWTGSAATLELTNCLAIGELSVSSTNCDVIARNPGRVTRTNCYYLTAFGNVPADLKKISAEQLTSGEVCYLLNGDQTNIQWTQAIATDAIPTPFPTGKKVFAAPTGGYRCDGKLLGETIYTNTDPQIAVPAHTFSNAFCQVCGKADPDYIKPNAEGFCELASAADLNWFACMVKEGNNTINACLTSDINNYAETMIGTANIYYDGIFDGKYHKITYSTEPTEAVWGLFRTLSGTVRNLSVAGTVTTSQKQVGGIVGFLYSGTIENCISTVDITTSVSGDAGTGGIIATSVLSGGVIKDCVFAGSIKGQSANSCAGIAGWTGSAATLELTNCLAIGELSVSSNNCDVIARNPSRVTRTNCYYLTAFGNVPADLKKISAEQLTSGEVCYLLNGDQTNIQWTQAIATDAIPAPFPTGKKVFATPNGGYRCDGTPQGETTYSNTDPQIAVPAHTFTDGICQVCGTPDLNYIKPNAEGFYELKSENDMLWFATRVNNGETLNAVLTADIDMTGLPTCMIGVAQVKPFTGVFDGQGHTIKLAINVENTGNYSGSLFRFVKDATFRRLRLTGSVTTRGKHPASLISVAAGKVLLEQISSDCNIYTNASDACMGGLVGLTGENDTGGFAADVTFNNCAFTGTITHTGDASQNHGGLFVGWKGNKNASVTVRNSFTAAKSITNSARFATFVRVWTSTDNGRTSFENCFYINDISEWLTKQGTEKTAEEFASGAVCSLLGGDFRQNIGEDAYPVLNSTHGIVKEIGSTGYATMYLPETSVAIPAGVEAFTGTIWNNLLGLNPLQNVVTKGQAVVLKGNAGYYSFVPTDADLGLIQSDLLGTAEPLATTGSQYVLAEKDGVVGFYKATGTIPAGKAYIEYAGAGVKGFAIGGATSIQNAQFIKHNDDAIYDLSGRRVEKMQKGIYIVNGKKLMK